MMNIQRSDTVNDYDMRNFMYLLVLRVWNMISSFRPRSNVIYVEIVKCLDLYIKHSSITHHITFETDNIKLKDHIVEKIVISAFEHMNCEQIREQMTRYGWRPISCAKRTVWHLELRIWITWIKFTCLLVITSTLLFTMREIIIYKLVK